MRDQKTPEEEALRSAIQNFIREHTPKGKRIEGSIFGNGYVDIQLYCDGAIHIMAYHCAREPGHEGRCWSANKNVEFDREN